MIINTFPRDLKISDYIPNIMMILRRVGWYSEDLDETPKNLDNNPKISMRFQNFGWNSQYLGDMLESWKRFWTNEQPCSIDIDSLSSNLIIYQRFWWKPADIGEIRKIRITFRILWWYFGELDSILKICIRFQTFGWDSKILDEILNIMMIFRRAG